MYDTMDASTCVNQFDLNHLLSVIMDKLWTNVISATSVNNVELMLVHRLRCWPNINPTFLLGDNVIVSTTGGSQTYPSSVSATDTG